MDNCQDALKELVEVVDEYLGSDPQLANHRETEVRLESTMAQCVRLLRDLGVNPNVTE